MFRVVAAGVVLTLTLATGCTGLIGEGGESFSNGGDDRRGETGIAAAVGTLHRLTRTQYANSVHDLLGASVTVPVADLPADDGSLGYTTGGVVSPSVADPYLSVAEAVAAQFVAGNVASAMHCAGATVDDACVTKFVDVLGTGAFRRPLTSDEHTRFVKLYESIRDQYDATTGVEILVRAALSSASFIYVVESTPAGVAAGEVVRLTGIEMATRLSMALWNRSPDQDLLERAEAGDLDTDEGVAEVAADMLEDDRAKEGLRNFYEQWFHTDILPNVQRELNGKDFPDASKLASEMQNSFRAMVDNVVWEQNGGIKELLLTPEVYVTPNTAPLYEMAPPTNGTIERMGNAPNRVGVLTQPAFLTAMATNTGSDPVHRGKFVFERLLCGTLAPPPATVNTVLPVDSVGLSTRERYAAHTQEETCNVCHKHMDPIGFAFENYDQLGGFRATDADKPVVATGEIIESGDANGTFDGAGALQAQLAKSTRVADCVVNQFAEYATGHVMSDKTDEDVELVSHAKKMRDSQHGALLGVVLGVVTAKPFAYRRVPAPAEGASE